MSGRTEANSTFPVSTDYHRTATGGTEPPPPPRQRHKQYIIGPRMARRGHNLVLRSGPDRPPASRRLHPGGAASAAQVAPVVLPSSFILYLSGSDEEEDYNYDDEDVDYEAEFAGTGEGGVTMQAQSTSSFSSSSPPPPEVSGSSADGASRSIDGGGKEGRGPAGGGTGGRPVGRKQDANSKKELLKRLQNELAKKKLEKMKADLAKLEKAKVGCTGSSCHFYPPSSAHIVRWRAHATPLLCPFFSFVACVFVSRRRAACQGKGSKAASKR